MRQGRLPTGYASSGQRRVERFIAKYLDTKVKAEVMRILTYRPTHYQPLAEVAALTSTTAQEVERALFQFRNFGLVQLKDSPRGPVVGLVPDSVARRLAPMIWAYLKRSGEATARGRGLDEPF